MIVKILKLLILSAFLFVASNGSSMAASYKKLTAQGYKSGKLTKSRGGNLGWYLSKDKVRYFCTMRASLAYVGKTGMVAFTSSGRRFKLSGKTFVEYLGYKPKDIPQLSDLEAGRVEPYHVGKCLRQRP